MLVDGAGRRAALGVGTMQRVRASPVIAGFLGSSRLDYIGLGDRGRWLSCLEWGIAGSVRRGLMSVI